MKRPNIKESFPESIQLKEVQETYDASPVLFSHIQRLDNFIDFLLSEKEDNSACSVSK